MRVPLLLLLLVPLAGCLGDGDVDDLAGLPVDPAPTTLPWGLSGCDFVIVLLPASAAAVEEHLPEGFSAVVHPAIGAPPDPRMEAIMGLEVLRCAEGAGLNGTIPGMAYGSFWTAVQPPADLEHEHSDLMFYKWDTLVPDAPRREALQAAGAAARDGGATFTQWQETPAGVAFDATLTMTDVGDFTFRGLVGKPEVFEGDFTEFSGAEAGIVHWRTWFRAEAGYAGAVLVELEPGSLPAQVVGETTVQGYALAGSGADFYDGWVRLP